LLSIAVAATLMVGLESVGQARAAAGPLATLQLGVAPIAQSQSGEQNLTVATATFNPAQPGAAVRIQRRSGNRWVDVPGARGTQDANGMFVTSVLAADDAGPYTFRAVSTPDDSPALISAGAKSADWNVKWADEFSANNTQMAVRPSGYTVPRTCSHTAAGQTTVVDGVAQLTVATDPAGAPAGCTPPAGLDKVGLLNAAVHTQSTDFTYGVFAARIKYQGGTGKHGAFWMMPAHFPNTGDVATDGAEIDISESFGDNDWGMQSNVYWNAPDGDDGTSVAQRANYTMTADEQDAIFGPDTKLSDGYHVYSVEWTPTEYIFRIDGVETFRTSQGVSHAPERVILSLLASDWEIKWMDQDTVADDHMDVDWVRVWQSPTSS
jgi:beta-glucanase (GH16 family)